MFYPLSLYIGLRYVLRRSHGFFVSFISWVSMLGICVGVAALITVLSVMNGLEGQIRSRMVSLSSHATLSANPEVMKDWRTLAATVMQNKAVTGVAPYVETQAMMGRGLQLTPVILRGVMPNEEPKVSDFGRYLKSGQLADLTSGSQRVILGAGLAWTLDARVGDELTVLVPQSIDAGESDGFMGLKPRMQSVIVSGIFEVELQEHDNVLALMNLSDTAALLGAPDVPTGLRLKFADVYDAPSMAPQIAADLSKSTASSVTSSDWSKENASYFRAVRLEKTMMTMILMLIVTVAAFNIVAALVMVVNEKRMDIAILRTLGLTPRSVIGIFMTQGVLIGWGGTLLGVFLGLTLAFNVDVIVPFLERVFGVHVFDNPDIYYVTQLPSEVRWPQVASIALVALTLAMLSTIYPSLRGARTEPAEALRYE